MFQGFQAFGSGVFLVLMFSGQTAQPPIRILNPTNPNPMPSDVRMNQFEDPKGASWMAVAAAVTVIAPTDRVVFYVRELIGEPGAWKVSESDVATLIRTAAQRLPVP